MSQRSVEIEIDAVITRQATSTIAISLAIACLMTLALWDSLDGNKLIYWLGILLSVSVLRLFVGYVPILFAVRKHAQLALTFAAGLIWGLSAPLFLPALDAHHQMLLLLVLIGIVAGSSNSYAGRMSLFYAFMVPVLIPAAVWLFAQGEQIYTTLGIIDLLYMFGLSMFAQRNTLLLKNSILKNNQLTDEITLREAYEHRLELQQGILDAIARHRGALSEILTIIVKRVESVQPDMFASILLLDEDGKHMHGGAAPSLPSAWNEAINGAEIGPKAGSCGTAAFRNERVIVADIATDPLWEDYRDAALSFGLGACWSEPIHDAGGSVLGTFAMYYHENRHPSDDDLKLIGDIAGLTSIAICNCRDREHLDAARQQQMELAQAVEHSSDLIYIFDLDGIVISANQASKRTFGGEVIGKNIAEIIAPDYLQLARDNIQKKLVTGDSTVYELDAIDSGGVRHHLEINASVITRDGKPVAINGIARDITARKEAENKLALLVQAINASHEAIMVLNNKGRIEFANPAAAQLFQKSLTDITGTALATLCGGS